VIQVKSMPSILSYDGLLVLRSQRLWIVGQVTSSDSLCALVGSSMRCTEAQKTLSC
jgi:hypothetical protein